MIKMQCQIKGISALSTAILTIVCGKGEAMHNNIRKDYSKPNIVYILADDLGYGDLGCYGQKHFETPNIDRMASEGMLFTQHYAGCTVCAPSRSSLMTGQTTGHTPIRGNKECEGEGQWPLPDKAYTIAEMLKDAGYVTGCFGKWGLGYPGSEGDPNMQGFDEFFGYNCQRLAHNYYPAYLWENQHKVMLEGNIEDQLRQYAPELIHRRAIEFIECNKDRAFFLYYPTIIPHAELLLPKKYIEPFHGKLLPEKSFKGTDFGNKSFRGGGYGSQEECHAAFAAMVTLLDKQVGEILSKLKELGLEQNTIVIFTSDNGPHLEGGADPDYFNSNGSLKGYKRDLYEGGIRVPMIAWWPGKIKTGSVTCHVSAFWDVIPTLGEIVGAEPLDNIDGISFLPTMVGHGTQKEHDYLYWEFQESGGRQAVRKGNWKLLRFGVPGSPMATIELFNLADDIGENNNVIEQHPGMAEKLLQLMTKARVPSKDFKF